MNCFIASAFDHQEVDAIYDRGILKILKALRINPARVDKVEHNEDIDNQISSLIDKADFCIADLTFARPSVYYEAGYAFGKGKPVIYIARADHFRARADDPAGNLRVHFDLQMKNIIAWTEPNAAFRKRLRRRVLHVLEPLLRKRRVTENNRAAELRFSSLSLNQRLWDILLKGRSLLHSRGYSKVHESQNLFLQQDRYHLHLGKFSARAYRHVHILTRPNIVKSGLTLLNYFWHPLLTRQDYGRLKTIESLAVVCSLKSVNGDRLAGLFPHWTPANDKLLERYQEDSSHPGISHPVRLAFMDGIKSIDDFSGRFRELLSEIDARPTRRSATRVLNSR